MHLSHLFLVAAATAIVLGFNIPSNQADGIYRVREHDNGTHEHIKIGDPSLGPEAKRWFWWKHKKGGPQLVQLTCGRGKSLNPEDTDAANADLFEQCGNGELIPGAHNFYAIRGTVVAFVCNFSGWWKPRTCFKAKAIESTLMIKEHCGAYNAGWADWNGGKISYGYDTTAIDFCGVGTGE